MGSCKVCGEVTIMFSYAGKGYLCLNHYNKFIRSIKIYGDKEMNGNEWKYSCMTCYGNGKEEKLSCGCTGYKMTRRCISCDGKGTVDLLTHNIQADNQREFFKKMSE